MDKTKEQVDEGECDNLEGIGGSDTGMDVDAETDVDCPFYDKEPCDYDGQYDYCPVCGKEWDKHKFIGDEPQCDPLLLIMREKPRFDALCLDDYTREKLVEIASWQARAIEVLMKEVMDG